MARRSAPSNNGSNPYGSYDDFYRQDPYQQGGQGSPYGGQDPYAQRGSYYAQQDPYAQASDGRRSSRAQRSAQGQAGSYGYTGASARENSPYGQQPYDPYAQTPSARSGRRQAQPQQGASPTAYPIGSGRTYTASQADAANRAAGVKPVTTQDLLRSPYTSTMRDRHGNKGPLLSRRGFLAAAGGTIVAALGVGFVGVNWYTHRAVACTVNGTAREAPIGADVSELIERGYAYPKSGNLVAISLEGETPIVLQEGGGEPYSVTVNGELVDPATWRLSEGDDVVFANGGDLTEEVNVQQTEIPCGVQYPDDALLLNSIGYVAQWGRNGVSAIETGLVSGRTIDRGITQEPQDLIIATSGVNPADGRRLVALTFDDGPTLDYTPQYLDILARYGAKATFFNLGTQLEGGPEYTAMAKRCADEGHQVASHTYSHSDITLTGMDVNTRNDEISRTFTLVSDATGVPTQVMRPPYGEFRGKGYLQYLESGQNIAYSAYWTVDSLDWDVATKTGLDDGAAAIIANCTMGLTADSYNGAIVLMHDGGGDRSRNVRALPGIIEAFQSAGYELVTLNEMLRADPTFPEWVWSGYAERPEGTIVPSVAV